MLTNILAGLSLILALATGGLWGRSRSGMTKPETRMTNQ
jgi:hypothetical protein